jgi:hypothetical protein
MTKPNLNERRLAKLLREHSPLLSSSQWIGCSCGWVGTVGAHTDHVASALPHRGVLAVCAATVPRDARDGITACYPVTVLDYLRRLARGVR